LAIREERGVHGVFRAVASSNPPQARDRPLVPPQRRP
jgi:hypothetical protein